jgi:hypothetical protein
MEQQAIIGFITAFVVEVGKRVTNNHELGRRGTEIVKGIAGVLSLTGVVGMHYATEGNLDVASFDTLVSTLVAYAFSFVTYKGIIKEKKPTPEPDFYV